MFVLPLAVYNILNNLIYTILVSIYYFLMLSLTMIYINHEWFINHVNHF